MGKNKLRKFSELETFERVFQPDFEEFFRKDFFLKGKWAKDVFKNSNPIILELGCGKGEYTVSQAVMHPEKNFIGIDIKGARMWRGAKTAKEKGLVNVAFLRIRIEFVEAFFSDGEIEELWITFPDPQLKTRRSKKRLTGPTFLNNYRKFMVDKGIVHLKTDNDLLYNYTHNIARTNGLEILKETNDLYKSDILDETLAIKTYYEKQFLAKGSNINYIAFRLPGETVISDVSGNEE